MTNDTYQINHQFECNEKCIVYLFTCKRCLKQCVGQTTIPFDTVGTTTKVTAENFNTLSHACKNICFGISQAQATFVFSMTFP